MKYVQSFYQYPVTFSSIGRTIPARSAQGEKRNVAEFSEKEIAKLEACEPFYRELVNKKKIRVLNHLPASYVPAAQRINQAEDTAAKLKAENEALKAKLAALEAGNATTEESSAIDAEGNDGGLTDAQRTKAYKDMTYDELKDACKYAGIEYKNKKKAELVELLSAFEGR